MQKKRKQYYLIGTVIMLLLSIICSLIFVQGNMNRIAEKKHFESVYLDTSIDYIVPGPSPEQVAELENDDSNGIYSVTPYYETITASVINGSPTGGTTILLPHAEKTVFTPYGSSRIVQGEKNVTTGCAIADQEFVDRFHCKVGDSVIINILGKDFIYKLTSISATNTYYSDGTIALVLTKEDADFLVENGLRYSAAYISASDLDVCEQFLTTEYKPLSRLRERSEFEDEDTYNRHLANFNEADWSKEVTNCQANYETLSVKYDNVQTSMWVNILIMIALIAIIIIGFNVFLLTNDTIKGFMKSFLIKKSGTKDEIKSFYKSSIILDCAVFALTFIVLYIIIASSAKLNAWGIQIFNLIIPIAAAIISSIIMIICSERYVENHYRVKIKKMEDETEEIQVEVS